MKNIEIIDFTIKELSNRQRKIRIFLPDGYYQNLRQRYPVLYMHDGQNLVDPSSYSGYSWDIARTLSRLQEEKIIDGIIVVGIDSDPDYRIPEYTHVISKKALKFVKNNNNNSTFLPEAHLYGKFIVDTLKPYIDTNYRTKLERINTGIAGSSCGGNVSLYLGSIYNDVFGVIGAFSPAYWIVKEDIFERLTAKDFDKQTKIYHDMGGKEAPFALLTYIRNAKKIASILDSKQLDDNHHKFVIDWKATHTELFWQSRFPEFIKWAYGNK